MYVKRNPCNSELNMSWLGTIYTANIHRVSDCYIHVYTSIMEKVLMGRAILAQPAKLVIPSGFTLSSVNIIIIN